MDSELLSKIKNIDSLFLRYTSIVEKFQNRIHELEVENSNLKYDLQLLRDQHEEYKRGNGDDI